MATTPTAGPPHVDIPPTVSSTLSFIARRAPSLMVHLTLLQHAWRVMPHLLVLDMGAYRRVATPRILLITVSAPSRKETSSLLPDRAPTGWDGELVACFTPRREYSVHLNEEGLPFTTHEWREEDSPPRIVEQCLQARVSVRHDHVWLYLTPAEFLGVDLLSMTVGMPCHPACSWLVENYARVRDDNVVRLREEAREVVARTMRASSNKEGEARWRDSCSCVVDTWRSLSRRIFALEHVRATRETYAPDEPTWTRAMIEVGLTIEDAILVSEVLLVHAEETRVRVAQDEAERMLETGKHDSSFNRQW